MTFEGCKLVGVSFTKVNPFLLEWVFTGCKLELCSFEGLKMKGSRFIGCALREADFTRADLTGSDFSGSDLLQARFQQTILEKADFTKAIRYYIDPTANRLKGAKFSYPNVLSLLAPFEVRVE